jgi:hypothetical protein
MEGPIIRGVSTNRLRINEIMLNRRPVTVMAPVSGGKVVVPQDTVTFSFDERRFGKFVAKTAKGLWSSLNQREPFPTWLRVFVGYPPDLVRTVDFSEFTPRDFGDDVFQYRAIRIGSSRGMLFLLTYYQVTHVLAYAVDSQVASSLPECATMQKFA